jgi:protein-tyrosine phosphatase
MTGSVNNISKINLSLLQEHQQDEGGFIDIHCHCLPCLDDGPASIKEAITLCRKMTDDGITTAIATPHQLGRFEGHNKAKQVRESVSNFNKILKQNNIALSILPGAEIRVDERIYRLKETDEILTLADGGKYILLELPNDIFIDIDPLIQELASIKVQSVIAHAEKIMYLTYKQKIIKKWLEHKALFQITASNLTGNCDLKFQENAQQLLNTGLVSFIATDSHNTNSRSPQMRAAFQFITENLGQEIAYRLCIENPSKILDSKDILTALTLNHSGVDR